MEPFTLLVLVGLASVGVVTIAYIATAVAYVIFFAVLCVLVVAIAIDGIVGDYFYDKKMLRGEVKYRLPWYYRLKGWQVGQDRDSRHDYQNGLIVDSRTNKWVPIVRLKDRAFSERYGLGWRD